MDEQRVEINGYSFNEEMGIAAKKEKTAIGVLSRKLDMDKPQTVMTVYKQIIHQKLFHTQVGYDFLKGLQNYLITNPEINNEDIESIEIESPIELMDALEVMGARKPDANVQNKSDEIEDGKFQKRAKTFMISTIVLGIVVILMFVITLTAKVPTVINYKSVLNDQYSSWEQELNKREEELSLKEQELTNQANKNADTKTKGQTNTNKNTNTNTDTNTNNRMTTEDERDTDTETNTND